MEGVDVEGFLYDTLADARGATRANVRATLSANGEIDSLEGVELVAAAEEQFDIKIEAANRSVRGARRGRLLERCVPRP